MKYLAIGIDILDDVEEKKTSLATILREIERQAILMALGESGWNKSRAAELLGINRTTLCEKIKKFGMTKETKKAEK